MSDAYTDMHMHSKFSDGDLSPRELCKRAKRNNLRAIAISDHDYCESYEEIQKEADLYGLETISGVEISCDYKGKDIHLLAYGLGKSQKLNDTLKTIRLSRASRAEKMVKLLQENFSLDIEFSDVLAISSENIARPHIARALIKKRIVSSLSEAFQKYLNNDSPAYVSKYKFDIFTAIECVSEANGLSSLAHFSRYADWDMLDQFCEAGLAAIEIYHPSHSLSLKAKLKNYAKERNLLKSGGSDFHGGKRFTHDLGSQKVPYSYFEKFQERLGLN